MNKPVKIILTIIIAAGLFYGGMTYGQSLSGSAQSASSAYGAGRTTRTISPTGAFAGGSATVGTVVSSDATSITIALKSGSVVAFYSTSTPVMITTSGTRNDIQAGDNITVIGTVNSDGSVTANSIQLRSATPNSTGQ